MNGATLKTIREALGLPVSWLSDTAGVQERTVRYWESGRIPAIPAEVQALLRTLESEASKLTAQAVVNITEQIKARGHHEGPVLLVRYADDDDLATYQRDLAGLPATFHAAILARIRWAMAEHGIEVETRMLDAQGYEMWLNATQQTDSPALRSQYIAAE